MRLIDKEKFLHAILHYKHEGIDYIVIFQESEIGVEEYGGKPWKFCFNDGTPIDNTKIESELYRKAKKYLKIK